MLSSMLNEISVGPILACRICVWINLMFTVKGHNTLPIISDWFDLRDSICIEFLFPPWWVSENIIIQENVVSLLALREYDYYQLWTYDHLTGNVKVDCQLMFPSVQQIP